MENQPKTFSLEKVRKELEGKSHEEKMEEIGIANLALLAQIENRLVSVEKRLEELEAFLNR